MYISRHEIGDLYNQLLIKEGLEEKISKVENMISIPSIIMNKKIVNPESRRMFIKWVAENFDPTPTKKYLTWLLKIVKNGDFRGLEDSYKISETLTEFTRLVIKNLIPTNLKDINRYNTYAELVRTVNQFSDLKSKKETMVELRESGIELIEKLDNLKLYKVTTAEAAAKYFRNTEWCVRDPRAFNEYYSPKIFWYITKNDLPHVLVHFMSNQAKNTEDHTVLLTKKERYLLNSPKVISTLTGFVDGFYFQSIVGNSSITPGIEEFVMNIITEQDPEGHLPAPIIEGILNSLMHPVFNNKTGELEYEFKGALKLVKVSPASFIMGDIEETDVTGAFEWHIASSAYYDVDDQNSILNYVVQLSWLDDNGDNEEDMVEVSIKYYIENIVNLHNIDFIQNQTGFETYPIY